MTEHERGVRDGVRWVAESLAAAWQQSTSHEFLTILRDVQDAAAADVAAWDRGGK